jgi:hypothetical protein
MIMVMTRIIGDRHQHPCWRFLRAVRRSANSRTLNKSPQGMAPSGADITTNCTLPAFDALAISLADLPEEATASVQPRPGGITLIATLRPRQTGADS